MTTESADRDTAGCITCKAKRLKCDETKPTCQQCARRSVTCGGYKKDFKWRPFEEANFTGTKPPPAKQRKGAVMIVDGDETRHDANIAQEHPRPLNGPNLAQRAAPHQPRNARRQHQHSAPAMCSCRRRSRGVLRPSLPRCRPGSWTLPRAPFSPRRRRRRSCYPRMACRSCQTRSSLMGQPQAQRVCSTMQKP